MAQTLAAVRALRRPEDQNLLQLPLCDRDIPIIADDYVDRAFGTGVVKVTPAHDFNDYAVGQRHKLPQICILTLDAKIDNNAPEPYRGLDRFEARKRIVIDLDTGGFLVKIDKHKLKVPIGTNKLAAVFGTAFAARSYIFGSLVGTQLALRHGNGFVRKLFLIVVSGLILKFAYNTFS